MRDQSPNSSIRRCEMLWLDESKGVPDGVLNELQTFALVQVCTRTCTISSFMMIYICWFMMICDDLCWFITIQDDSSCWFLMIYYDDLWWSTMIYGDLWSFMTWAALRTSLFMFSSGLVIWILRVSKTLMCVRLRKRFLWDETCVSRVSKSKFNIHVTCILEMFGNSMETFVDEALHWIFFLAIGMVEGDWLHRKKGSWGSCSHLYTGHRHQDRDFMGQHMQTLLL